VTIEFSISKKDGDNFTHVINKRTQMNFKYHENKYLITETGALQQYNDIYRCRLLSLKQSIIPQLSKPICDHLNNIVTGIECSIVGVLYKNFTSRQNILQDYKEIGADSQNIETFQVSDSDTLFLEDGTGRVQLIGLYNEKFTTGAVIGVRGILDSQRFTVTAGPFFPEYFPPKSLVNSSDSVKIAFVSCLYVNEPKMQSLHMSLSHFLKNVDVLVLLGNIFVPHKVVDSDEMVAFHEKIKREPFPISKLESFLKICNTKLTVLMPGSSDPCSISLPQQPYHTVLIDNPKVTNSTNPSFFEINGVSVLCDAGESPNDISQTTSLSFYQSQEFILRCLHVAPSSPDHLPSFPLKERDLLIIDEMPNVFVCGCAEIFETGVYNDVKIISVPSFNTSGGVVLYDTQSGNAEFVQLKKE